MKEESGLSVNLNSKDCSYELINTLIDEVKELKSQLDDLKQQNASEIQHYEKYIANLCKDQWSVTETVSRKKQYISPKETFNTVKCSLKVFSSNLTLNNRFEALQADEDYFEICIVQNNNSSRPNMNRTLEKRPQRKKTILKRSQTTLTHNTRL